jgi:hypothetical protein
MSPESQRIAIAESVGIHLHDGDHAPSNYVFATDLPDYLNDLNAMHEAEKMLEEVDIHTYGCYFSELYEKYGNTVSLTAAQRAESYLRTLGKWEGGSDE